MFNPHASVVGSQGSYGRFAGVNWIWSAGVLGIHVVYSVGLPILPLGLALPETRGRPLLSSRGIRTALVLYVLDIAALIVIANYWRTAPWLLLAAAGIAGVLWVATRSLPTGTLDPARRGPRIGPRWFFALGFAFYPILVLVPGIGAGVSLWPPVTIAVDLVLCAALFLFIRREAGGQGNEAALTMLALGGIAPIAGLGLVFQLSLPIVIVPDVLFGLFFYALWIRYRPRPLRPPVRAT